MIRRQGDHIMQRTSGFTLMELMITIAILAIISFIAIPNLISWFPQYRLNVAAREMVSTIQMARLKAIKGNTDIIVAVNVGADRVTVFEDDGAGSADADNNGIPDNAVNWVRDGIERTFDTEPVPPGIDITAANFSGSASVRFNRRGFPVDVAGNAVPWGIIIFDNGRGGVNSVIPVQMDMSGNARIP